jgi:ABC-type multidrug transport system fused ATPase/permease subunit
MSEQVSMLGQSDSGPPGRSVVGTLLMLPIGLIIVLMLLLYFLTFRGAYFPGDLLLIFVVIFLGLFVVRSLYWRSRRKYWRERWRENGAARIVRQRYARGEITKEQFDQMTRDLEEAKLRTQKST